MKGNIFYLSANFRGLKRQRSAPFKMLNSFIQIISFGRIWISIWRSSQSNILNDFRWYQRKCHSLHLYIGRTNGGGPMRDPIVEEVRKHRMEHTRKFRGDLSAICADLRRVQSASGHEVVRLSPRKLKPTNPIELKSECNPST